MKYYQLIMNMEHWIKHGNLSAKKEVQNRVATTFASASAENDELNFLDFKKALQAELHLEDW